MASAGAASASSSLPGLDLAVAMNAGNYPKPGIEQRRIADTLLTELVLPAVM